MQKIRRDRQLGSNIRACRLKSKLTQGQVVAQMQIHGCKISRETYAKIESGIANIRVDELVALAKIFKTDIGTFFYGY
jgi:transcriptional regulator with XRE-family HTH domain